MENKVLKKAAEFSSLEELGLPDEMVCWLKDAGASVEDVIAVVRSSHLTHRLYRADIIFDDLLSRGFISEDGYDAMYNEWRKADRAALTDSLIKSVYDKSTIVSSRVGFVGFILREYAISVMTNEGGEWDWVESKWGDDVKTSRVFNDFYEGFDEACSDYEDKVQSILALLKVKLTPGQYEMAEFELTHPEFYERIFGKDDDSCDGLDCYEDDGINDGRFFTVTAQESRLLNAARYNSRKFLRHEIRAILLS